MKIKELQEILVSKGLDYGIFFNTSMTKKDSFVTYFSGLDIELVFVIIPKKGIPFVVISNLELGRAKKLSKIKKIFSFEKDLFGLLKEKLGVNKKIGINNFSVTIHESKLLKKHLKVKLVDISEEIKNLRECKTDEEINTISKAAKVGDEVFRLTLQNFKNFKTELDIKNFMDDNIRKRGFEPSFETIINSGSNASYGHYSTTNEKLKKGFCIIDFGVKMDNYCSDITRTVYIGKISDKEIETYGKILEVQKKTIEKVKVGMKYHDLDKISRDVIGKNLIHGLGHGLGLDVHEEPRIGPNSKDKIKLGHVFTVEPGEYIAGKYGIRIEDDVAITKKGVKVLTKTSKDLVVLK
jgi:Xaa-Pro aminopeptidase